MTGGSVASFGVVQGAGGVGKGSDRLGVSQRRIEAAETWAVGRLHREGRDGGPGRQALIGFHLAVADARLGERDVGGLRGVMDTLLERIIAEYQNPGIVLPDGDVVPGTLLHSVLGTFARWTDSEDVLTRHLGFACKQDWDDVLTCPDPRGAVGLPDSSRSGRPPASGTDKPLPEAVPAPERPLGELLAELDELIGLSEVKVAIRRQYTLQHLNAERISRGLPRIAPSRHMVFTGNPGTGKTTVARLVAGIYHAAGLLSRGQLVEVAPGDMMARYQGANTDQAQAVIDSAVGGVLLVDEAYALAGSSDQPPMEFAQQVIDTLVKAMEDQREDLVVIFTGYPEPMQHFLATNAGLESRIGEIVSFPDYTTDELLNVFNSMLGRHAMTTDPQALTILARALDAVERTARFGNARLVRNIFEDAVAALAHRLTGQLESMPNSLLGHLASEDLAAAVTSLPSQLQQSRSRPPVGFAPKPN